MQNIISLSKNWFRSMSRTKIIILIVILVLVLGGYLLFKPKAHVYEFISVKEGPIIETVSVTGNTTPISSVSLGFGNSGTIARVNSSVGKNVSKGQVLAEINASDLYAQLKQAQANLALQVAQKQNTTLNIDQVQKQQDVIVNNAYQLLLKTTPEAVAKDAPEDNNTTRYPLPAISGNYLLGREGVITIKTYSASGGLAFTASGLVDYTRVILSTTMPLGNSGLSILFPPNIVSGLTWTITLPNTRSINYATNKNAYDLALANRDKAIADAQAQIATGNTGSTVSEAQIQSAQAGVQSVEAKFQNYRIIAPISGVVTQFDAKVGQFATPGSPLISIISNNSFEVDALISETDIGKVVLDNKVTMTLDAFPNETFTGTVFYVDPAQTTSQGVVGYKIKVAFDKTDPRMKSGLTSNLKIETRSKDNVLILPQYAILQNDKGTFVQVLEGKVVKDMPVTLGLQDQDGNVEIVSGVTLGEQVLNIGLKSK